MFRTNVKANDDEPSFNAIATYSQADISYIAMSGSDAGGDISCGSFGSVPGFNNTGQAAFSARFSDLAASDSMLYKSQVPNGIIATEGSVANGTPDTNGDGTPDGDVDDTDLDTAFSGYTGPLGPTNVPEPASAVMLLISSALLVKRRHF